MNSNESRVSVFYWGDNFTPKIKKQLAIGAIIIFIGILLEFIIALIAKLI